VDCEAAVSGLRSKVLEIIGIPCTVQEKDIHFRMLQNNKLRNSLELIRVLFWFRKLLKVTFHSKPSKIAVDIYRLHFRLIMERNSSKCRIGWLLYRVVKRVRIQGWSMQL
jgi:hypothetical protein